VIACGLSFLFAYQEARELQDGQLKEIAALIDNGALAFTGSRPSVESSQDADVKVVIDRLSGEATGFAQAAGLIVPNTLADGFHDLDDNGERWRVNIRTLRSGERIALAEPSALRDEIARDGAMRTLIPMLILLPGLGVVIVVIVRTKLGPLSRLANVVDQQTDVSLEPLSEDGITASFRVCAKPSVFSADLSRAPRTNCAHRLQHCHCKRKTSAQPSRHKTLESG
jgi:two-component system OmpR family sensor kinase